MRDLWFRCTNGRVVNMRNVEYLQTIPISGNKGKFWGVSALTVRGAALTLVEGFETERLAESAMHQMAEHLEAIDCGMFI